MEDKNIELLQQAQEQDQYIQLAWATVRAAEAVRAAIDEIAPKHGKRYDGALRPAALRAFEEALVKRPIKYLEIGSRAGLSLAVIAKMLDNQITATCVDPYEPYEEVSWPSGETISMDWNTDALWGLCDHFHIDAKLYRMTSRVALPMLIDECQMFDLIYIDGSHSGWDPLHDAAMSLYLLRPQGVIMLDDPLWPDVRPAVRFLAEHMIIYHASWKTYVYRSKK